MSMPLPRRALLLAALATTALSACGRKASKPTALGDGATVLALGDSLTSGVGASADAAYPAVLEGLTGWRVVNGGVSGDTAAQALARLPALLQQHTPALVIVGVGGNDFLRRLDPAVTREQIRQICQAATAAGAQVLLVGVPQFSLLAAAAGRLSDHPLYAELATELKVPLYSGGWSEVLADERLRSDAVHANAAGYLQFAEGLAQRLQAVGLLTRVK